MQLKVSTFLNAPENYNPEPFVMTRKLLGVFKMKYCITIELLYKNVIKAPFGEKQILSTEFFISNYG